ncbi:hypothetical protein BCR42DRAFT_316459 [Absidia repens]|uniref:Swiss Army Knife 2H phosphoesterase domain-containing protein n=1 Tax=Absidia repens TaxID=90262 RepID=A0A1X2J051_9FUNG|nr:hypothetical protein BCR42DRAFT_316459 [Absidia repens]
MQLDFNHVAPVLNAINSTYQPLLSRGEAHITVISPPEYRILSKQANITMAMLNTMARDSNIQASEFEVVCLGKVQRYKNVVYQLIVSSPSLVRLRERIFRLYYSNHGNPSFFDPHVSLQQQGKKKGGRVYGVKRMDSA